MRFLKQGISFSYHDDRLTLRWPWVDGKAYISEKYHRDFNSLKEYWFYLGSMSWKATKPTPGRVQGFTCDEVLGDFLESRYNVGYYVVLHDVRHDARGPDFWKKIPQATALHFTYDYVVLSCSDRSEMETLVRNIAPNFATATGFESGRRILDNLKVT